MYSRLSRPCSRNARSSSFVGGESIFKWEKSESKMRSSRRANPISRCSASRYSLRVESNRRSGRGEAGSSGMSPRPEEQRVIRALYLRTSRACARCLRWGLHDSPGWFRIVRNVKTNMPRIGEAAPLFSLADADMETVGLAAFKGRKNVVLYFYSRDGTPGCTLQAIEFSDHDEDFARHDCVVLGVSPDDCISHAEFRDKHGLSVCLLADPEAEVCEQYGVREVKDGDGVKKTSIVRATFVIDKKGRLRHALYGVNPRGHAMEVLQL